MPRRPVRAVSWTLRPSSATRFPTSSVVDSAARARSARRSPRGSTSGRQRRGSCRSRRASRWRTSEGGPSGALTAASRPALPALPAGGELADVGLRAHRPPSMPGPGAAAPVERPGRYPRSGMLWGSSRPHRGASTQGDVHAQNKTPGARNGTRRRSRAAGARRGNERRCGLGRRRRRRRAARSTLIGQGDVDHLDTASIYSGVDVHDRARVHPPARDLSGNGHDDDADEPGARPGHAGADGRRTAASPTAARPTRTT